MFCLKMKNKKQKHRHKKLDLNRPQPFLDEKPVILIVCEGKNTEPSYFSQFRISSAKVIAIGEGYNTISLVDRTIELAKNQSYDQIWCVFDKDDFPNQDFNTAIKKAESSYFKVAYSNQAFEYWLILHFEDHQGGKMHRDDYHDKLNNLLEPFNVAYSRTKKVEEDFFELLDGIDSKTRKKRVELAIHRAKRNIDMFPQDTTPAERESSTTVYKLVEELLKYT